MKIHVIGCGGGASHFLPNFLRTFKDVELTLQDGDTLEERNLDRQLFNKKHVGKNKAVALAMTLGLRCNTVESYWRADSDLHTDSFVLCFADNNTCRADLMKRLDDEQSDVVFITAANGERDAQAYAYHHALKDTEYDPRSMFPRILEPDYSPAYNCTAPEVAEERPQTLFANALSATLALFIFRSWFLARPSQAGRPVSVYADMNNFTVVKTPLE